MDAAQQASWSFTISQSFPKFMSIESVMPSNHLILCCPLLLLPQSFPASGSFPMSQSFTSGGQSIGASASVLLMNIQVWFPLGLTGLSPLFSKGLSRVFASTTVTKHQSFCALPSLHPTLIPFHDYWKNRSLDYMDLWWQSDVFNMLSRFLIVRYYSDIKNILSLLLLLLSRFSCVQLCVTP